MELTNYVTEVIYRHCVAECRNLKAFAAMLAYRMAALTNPAGGFSSNKRIGLFRCPVNSVSRKFSDRMENGVTK
ncbi:hypothetical protein T265_09971 [Opisthorchis viverrini]|uniref:Uncharacterized protein n=1 Tax=Opisthorchis viverrini TaxID=6198 RepID=A0A074Z3X7_OPIVI|nr:hypothetical protein T265_09971 [Opisthorchis viverrini]KER21786.1 hypothetical protein T265_09971 [Opisthorchis viverrini]